MVFPTIGPSGPIAIIPDGNSNSPARTHGPNAAIAGRSASMTCLTRPAFALQSQQIDLDDAADRAERGCRHDGQGTGDIGEMMRPDVEEVGEILGLFDIDLRFDRMFERRSGGLQAPASACARSGTRFACGFRCRPSGRNRAHGRAGRDHDPPSPSGRRQIRNRCR